MMWTNKVIRNDTSGLFVEFTSPDNRTFTKRYDPVDGDVNEFITSKLNGISMLWSTYNDMIGMKNVENILPDNWTFKLVKIEMPYDYIEMFVEIRSPFQTMHKMFQTTGDRSTYYVLNWMSTETSKVSEMIQNNDLESLSDYFGVEVTEWRQ